jgi:hypothetical protein
MQLGHFTCTNNSIDANDEFSAISPIHRFDKVILADVEEKRINENCWPILALQKGYKKMYLDHGQSPWNTRRLPLSKRTW